MLFIQTNHIWTFSFWTHVSACKWQNESGTEMLRIRHESNNKTLNLYTALLYQNVLVLATKTKSAHVSYLGNLINISWTGNNLKSDIPARLALWRKWVNELCKVLTSTKTGILVCVCYGNIKSYQLRTRMITNRIGLHSVLLPLLIVSITKCENLSLGIFINVNKSHWTT